MGAAPPLFWSSAFWMVPPSPVRRESGLSEITSGATYASAPCQSRPARKRVAVPVQLPSASGVSEFGVPPRFVYRA